MPPHTDRLLARVKREQINLPPHIFESAHVIFERLHQIKSEADRYNKEIKNQHLTTDDQCDHCERNLGKVRKKVNASIDDISDLILDLSRLYQKELINRQKVEDRMRRKNPCMCK